MNQVQDSPLKKVLSISIGGDERECERVEADKTGERLSLRAEEVGERKRTVLDFVVTRSKRTSFAPTCTGNLSP